MSGPYAYAAGEYWAAAWRGVLPLPARRKKSPPGGYTGWDGAYPSWPDVMAWVETQGDGNIALHLPDGVLGIDVDAYPGKIGGDTLARREAAWGPLPATWRTTSRDDGISGIRLYRVPVSRGAGGEAVSLAWPGSIGPGIETVHRGHRYAVVPPSIHPDTGLAYRWIGPDEQAQPSSAPPRVVELPELPSAWVIGLTEGREAHTYQGAGMDEAEIRAWLEEHWGGTPCGPMSEAGDEMLDDMRGGAHESLRLLMRLVGMAAVGHPGLREVLGVARKEFIAEVTSRRDDEATAAQEWTRSLFGAVDKVLGEMAKTGTRTSRIDPCDGALVSPAAAPAPAVESWEPPPGSVEEPTAEPGDDDSLDNEHQPREMTDEEVAAAAAVREENAVQDELRNLRIREKAKQRLQAENAPKHRWLNWGEIKTGPEPEPLVVGALWRDSLSRVFGAAGSGKSFVAIDLALRVALGMEWGGNPVHQTNVAYVAAEGQRVNKWRFEAWQERHQVEDAQLEGRFFGVPDALMLTEAGVAEFVVNVKHAQVGLVVLDTKNAMMVGEENSATDTAVMRRALDAIRKATDACVVLIDHTGKTNAEEARGSSATKAAMDTEVRVDNDGERPAKITVTVTRDKADEAGKTWDFMLRTHPLGEGKPAAVLLPLGNDLDLPDPKPSPSEVERAWTDTTRALPEAVAGYDGPGRAAMPDLARFMTHDAGTADPDGIGVTRAQAQGALSVKKLGPVAGHSEAAVRRAWSALRSMGYIAPADGKDGSDGKAENTTGRHVWTARNGLR